MQMNRRGFHAVTAAGLLGASSLARAQSTTQSTTQPSTQSKDIVIGQVASLSGANGADLGQGLQLGIRAYVDSVNAKGGINGRRLKLVSLDDEYLPQRTVELTKELIEAHQPVALLGYRGTANTLALIKSKVLEDSGVPLVGTLSGALEIQGAPLIFHVRTSYPQEISQLVLQLARLGLNRLGLLYVDDAFGKSGREAVLNAAKASKSSVVVEAAYDKAADKVEASVQAAVDKLIAAQPQAVVMVAVGDPVYSFVRLAKAKSASVRLFSISVVNPALVVEKVGLQAAKGMGFSQVFPFPYSDATPLSREYRAALRRTDEQAQPNYFSLEGYIYAKVLVAALRRAGNNPLPASVKAALDSFPSSDLGGFVVKFNPESRNGSSYSDLTIIASNGKLMK
jgi:branched-chain amino acid transport system substrate-binding protein